MHRLGFLDSLLNQVRKRLVTVGLELEYNPFAGVLAEAKPKTVERTTHMTVGMVIFKLFASFRVDSLDLDADRLKIANKAFFFTVSTIEQSNDARRKAWLYRPAKAVPKFARTLLPNLRHAKMVTKRKLFLFQADCLSQQLKFFN